MINFLNANEVEKIDERLTAFVRDQHPDVGGTLYAEVAKVEIDYECGDAFTNITIHFGRQGAKEEKQNFEHRVEIIFYNDNLDFIVGQFAQKILDDEL